MSKLFGLLVGIAEYHPSSGVGSLTGCVNDVNSVEEYLSGRFAPNDLKLVKLLNESATRKSVIDSFLSHLVNNDEMKEGDTAFFYYTGHGSYATSNVAFKAIDPLGRDETLVLYDSRALNGRDLADKEIALLIHSIPRNVKIVLVIDSCHSGSITRSAETADRLSLGKAKHTPARRSSEGRPLSDYFSIGDLNYEQMHLNGKLEIPETRHVVLSACSRGEVAYESAFEPTSLFTSHLMKILNGSQVNLSYLELSDYLHTLLARKANRQTPELTALNGFDPRLEFLGERQTSGTPQFRVVYNETSGKWTIDCGAIHGLRNDAASIRNARVLIERETLPKGMLVPIKSVGLTSSELDPGDDVTPEVYKGTVVNLRPALSILVKGSQPQTELWKTVGDKQQNGNRILFITDDAAHYDYTLKIDDTQIVLYRNDTVSTLVHGVENVSEKGMAYMHRICRQVYHWHQLLDVENSQMNEVVFQDQFKTDFHIELETPEGVKNAYDSVEVCVPPGGKIQATLKLTTTSDKPFYVALYYLSDRYAVKKRTLDDPRDAILKPDIILRGLKLRDSISLPEKLDHDIDRYKLLISKTPFEVHHIPEFKAIRREIVKEPLGGLMEVADDDDVLDQTWFAKTISIRSIRSSGHIQEQTDCPLLKINFRQHSSFKAEASVLKEPGGTKSAHPSGLLKNIVVANGHEVISLGDATKNVGQREDVISLSGIENEEQLVDEPLELRLNNLIKDDEEAIALTMVDGMVVPIASSSRSEDGSAVMLIHSLPETGPLPGDQKKKNILRAVWFCLVKVTTRKNPSMLRWISFEDEKPKYNKENVTQKVAEATSILLVVHGIIGNTTGQVACMKSLVPETYDLILAYDYENLNTDISLMAADLADKLSKAGIDGRNKRIDIAAHSMGGLVSRFMIEHNTLTKGWVNRLFMFGTPNGGSAFGKIVTWQQYSIYILTLACNAGKAYLGAIGPFLEALKTTLSVGKHFTNSLGQMRSDSDFIRQLNAPPVHTIETKYYIIAGNIQNYSPDEGSWLSRIIEKAEVGVGNVVYGETPNDIAVSVPSILDVKNVKVERSEVIAGHHLNYFELEESIKTFKTFL